MLLAWFVRIAENSCLASYGRPGQLRSPVCANGREYVPGRRRSPAAVISGITDAPRQFIATYGFPGVAVLIAGGFLESEVLRIVRNPLKTAGILGMLAFAAWFFWPVGRGQTVRGTRSHANTPRSGRPGGSKGNAAYSVAGSRLSRFGHLTCN